MAEEKLGTSKESGLDQPLPEYNEEASNSDKSGGLDTAWKFLDNHRDAELNIDMNALRRKIDLHIVPLMFLCYTAQFLDKVILNYANVMGMSTELHLAGNDFSNVATFMFVALLCFEVPNSTFMA
jgi:hypothetical protein